MKGVQSSFLQFDTTTLIDVVESPTTRMLQLGGPSLGTPELIALLLGKGPGNEDAMTFSNRLLVEAQGLHGLHQKPVSLLAEIRGMTPHKLAVIKAAIEIGRRIALGDIAERHYIHQPRDAASLVQYEMSGLEYESLRVILMNSRNRVMDVVEVYRGGTTSMTVNIRDIMREPIRRGAVSIIMVHNHPSGELAPSPQDKHITKLVREAGKLMDIELIDHVIVAKDGYYSMKEKGVLTS